MVYKIFSDELVVARGKQYGVQFRFPRLRIQEESRTATIVIRIVKAILILYDILSFPIYFALQRPDLSAKEAHTNIRSEKVDINTWTKTIKAFDKDNFQSLGSKPKRTRDIHRSQRYMGSTLDVIFANSTREYSHRPCLGYRTVVTCPALIPEGGGKESRVDKSFRSDYTWYTYEQIGQRVQDMASGLYYHSVVPGSRAFFFANTCLEWFCASQACFQLSAQIVLAPDIDDTSILKSILIESAVKIIFTSCNRLNQLRQILDSFDCSSQKNLKVEKIILIDWLFSVDYKEPMFAEFQGSSSFKPKTLLSIGQLEEIGVEHPIELTCNRTVDEFQKRRDLSSTISGDCKLISGDPVDQFLQESRLDIEFSSYDTYNYRLGRKYSKQSSQNDQEKENRRREFGTNQKPEDLAIISYTYGAGGQVKAIAMTQSYITRRTNHLYSDGMISDDDIHCTTLSLDNIIEFITEMCVFSHGGSIGYSCNQETLFFGGKELFKKDRSDLEALNPTFLLVRPRTLEHLRMSIYNYLSFRMNTIVSLLLMNVLYDYKKYWVRRYFRTPLSDLIFRAELKRLFGVNLKYILCNGATDCSETKDFFAFMIGVPIIELYGHDEAILSLVSVNDIWNHGRMKMRFDQRSISTEEQEDFNVMHLMSTRLNKEISKSANSRNLLITSSILCPTIGSRIRLEDWEDFRTTDEPYPRGRLIIGGDVVCDDYFIMPKLSNKFFYSDENCINWFRTGDIARVFSNGSFEIISGISDMIKMLDGQFISLSQLEHVLRNSQFVENVCAVCVDDRKFVIALIVPNLRRIALKSFGQAEIKMIIGPEPEPDELKDLEFRREVCNDRLLCEFINKHLSELMAGVGCQTIPKRFHLVPEIWTPETELVTPNFEPKRNTIQKYYAADIQSILRTEFSVTRDRLAARLTKAKKASSNLSIRMNQIVHSRLSF